MGVTLGQGPRTSLAPRLTVSILTKNSENRLGGLLAMLSTFADEIVVGIDDQTTDRTAEIAAASADVVFYFRHAGTLAGARMLTFDYASGDWIFVLDDDEGLEASFPDLLPGLLADPAITHYWFPRKWIVEAEPLRFLNATPWYPDWQLRLFRNDRTLAWKPSQAHSGYHVMGPGHYETRASLLHFEPLICTEAARGAKAEIYRRGSPLGDWERFYIIPPHVERKQVGAEAAAGVCAPRARRARVYATPRDVTGSISPAWGMTVLNVEVTAAARCSSSIIAELTLLNSGRLTWMPNWGLRSASLMLSHHLLDDKSQLLLWDCERTQVMVTARPGAIVMCIHQFCAPSTPGDYILQWDMVSHGECWFGGYAPTGLVETPLHVDP